MVLRGCKRNIIMVKDTGSEYFDLAYFVLRCDLPAFSKETDMIAEARRMIEGAEQCAPAAMPAPKSNRFPFLGIFLPCLVILSVIGAAVVILLV